ncbi:MAG: (d)CMP kinase [Bacteroidales bacterium]|nr:(d)CMP kinase [Bacteroidales bacterium]
MTELVKKIIIAIDGYSSCGKSSYAKLIANELGYLYIDSGAMYRAVSLFALQNKMIENGVIDEISLIRNLPKIEISFQTDGNGTYTLLNDENVEKKIRNLDVSSVVSEISKIYEVRERLVQMQRTMGKNKGIVMDGRDIGTIVFPEAEMKIFMTADPKIRAKRRFDELRSKGIPASLLEIESNIEHRDNKDTNREISPLRKAEDALVLDNSRMTFDDQMLWFTRKLFEKGLLKKN